MDRRLKVCHIISKLPIGGVEKQLYNILRNYGEDINPIVISLTNKGIIGEKIEKFGIEVIELNSLTHAFNLSTINKIRKILKDRKVDIVRTHQYHANLYGRIAAKLEKIRCIIPSIHNLYTRDKKFHRRIINKILSYFSHKIVAVSQAVKDDIIKYDWIKSEHIEVIYNGINFNDKPTKESSEIKKELKINQDQIVIGNIARLTEQKGHKHLLLSLIHVIKNYKNIKVLIVGGGELLDSLVNLTKSLNLQDYVIFTGFREDVDLILDAIDIFVFPSLWEGFPNAVLEAMAAKKAIIASNIKPIRELITHEYNGLLVNPDDHIELAACILKLINNKDLLYNLSYNAYKTVRENFDIKKTVESYKNLFQNILKANKHY